MLGEALRLVRVYHDLTQTQLSYELGISNSFLSEIESGKKSPTLELLGKYSSHFEIPISSLLFFSENIDDSKITSTIKLSLGKNVLSLLDWASKTQKRRKTAKA